MERVTRQCAGALVLWIFIITVIRRVDCHPSRTYSFSPSPTTSVTRIFPATLGISREFSEGGKRTDKPVDDANELVYKEAFRTTLDDSNGPSGHSGISSSGQISLRQGDGNSERRNGGTHHDQDKIVFPDDAALRSAQTVRRIPACRSGTFCEEASNYPTDVVNRAIQMNDKLKYLQIRDELEASIGLRTSREEEVLCESQRRLYRPKIAPNKDNELRFIVNTVNFTQALVVEICENRDSECKLVNEFSDGYKTTCKQNYVYRELLAIFPNNTISSEMFQIPASCCCHVQFVGDPMLRMGINLQRHN